MKWHRTIAVLFLVAAMLTGSALAHSHPGDVAARPIVSDWARAEVTAARSLGFVDDALLPLDCRAPMTREGFAELAMSFVAMQTSSDKASLDLMVARYLAPTAATPTNVKNAFTDGNWKISLAYYLGLVQGKGDGRFDPEGLITRQEAAVMLTRAYAVYGGTLPEAWPENVFTDEADIGEWARPSADALAYWGVMNGMEDGSFSPDEHYSVEQCIVTLLRLYEKAPVSQKAGNITPVFTYAQALSCLTGQSGGEARETLRIESEGATFLRLDLGGMLRATSGFYLVSQNGGLRQVDLGVCNEAWGFTPAGELENPRFSKDGKSFLCSVTLEEDVVWNPDGPEARVLHEKGMYHITIDLASGAYKHQFVA